MLCNVYAYLLRNVRITMPYLCPACQITHSALAQVSAWRTLGKVSAVFSEIGRFMAPEDDSHKQRLER